MSSSRSLKLPCALVGQQLCLHAKRKEKLLKLALSAGPLTLSGCFSFLSGGTSAQEEILPTMSHILPPEQWSPFLKRVPLYQRKEKEQATENIKAEPILPPGEIPLAPPLPSRRPSSKADLGSVTEALVSMSEFQKKKLLELIEEETDYTDEQKAVELSIGRAGEPVSATVVKKGRGFLGRPRTAWTNGIALSYSPLRRRLNDIVVNLGKAGKELNVDSYLQKDFSLVVWKPFDRQAVRRMWTRRPDLLHSGYSALEGKTHNAFVIPADELVKVRELIKRQTAKKGTFRRRRPSNSWFLSIDDEKKIGTLLQVQKLREVKRYRVRVEPQILIRQYF